MKKKKTKRFPDYELVDTTDIVTFGTAVFLRKDKQALKIVFPSGQIMTFAPVDEKGLIHSKGLASSHAV